jgi:hypothetical protein
MGKNKKRHHKSKSVSPDEVFSRGPLHMARFGNHVVMKSDFSKIQHDELLAKMAARYESLVLEIDDLVNLIVLTVSTLPPDQLLTRAYQELVFSSKNIKVESDVKMENSNALRMSDYIQSVIAATPRGEEQKSELSEDDWLDLKTNVASLFEKLNLEYPLCSSAHRRTTEQVHDDAMEEFFTRAQMHWCNVRGDYYQIHQVDVITDLLRNQSELIKAAYGVTSDELLKEIQKIWHSLTFGLQEAMTSMHHIHAEVMAEIDRMSKQQDVVYEAESPSELLREVTSRLGYQDSLNHSADKFFNMGLFDLCKITDLPIGFLEDFSWAPGQETEFLADGEFKGWPLRIQPIFKRPFLKLNDTYYCFELYSLFDHFYRQIEKRIFQRSEAEKQEWIRNRKVMSENLPIEYFKKLLPGAIVLPEIYYPIPSGFVGTGKLAEVDCVIIYEDHIFIIEVKAGAFTYTSPANDLPAYIKSLETLVGAPSKQGQRFLKYLESAEEVDIFDAKRKPVSKLRRNDFRCKNICAVTLDPFTELSAQTQHLHKIGVDVGDVPVWALSLSDLRVYRDIFTGPLDFLHFVEQRINAASSEKLQLDDELDHLGLFLEHNNYVMYVNELSKNGARMQFNGYRSSIDAYFSAKLTGTESSPLPTQKVPPRIREIIDFLAEQNQPQRSRIASYLLGFAGDFRSDLSNWIDEELAEIPQRGRCLPLSTVGDVRLTVIVNIEDSVELSHDEAIEHSQAAMIAVSEADRILLELTYAPNGLIQVSMTTISMEDLSDERIELIKQKANNLKVKRVAISVAKFGKIGRNETCPCGSQKKYKRCCGS